ncbi:LPS export ABC transporter permease LptF, partial [Candidatus Saccharibacteria bacterium]|nr:LPS export ABC transporter permease LptF [Candidatus Saccharibacteria bacterium]
MILRLYLIRELTQSFFAVTLVLLLIVMSNKLVGLISKVAMGVFGANVLFQMIWLQLPELFAIILPIALFLAVLLCFGKLFVDLEIPMMLACGVSWRFLMSTVFVFSIPVSILSALLSLYLSPLCYQYRDMLLQEEGPMLLIQTVVPGRFHAFKQDRWIFYVANLNPERTELRDIFIAEQPAMAVGDKDWSVMTAKRGEVIYDKHSDQTYVHLYQGKRYQGKPGERDYTVISFEQYQKLLEQTIPQKGLFYHRSMPTYMLLDNASPSYIAEFHWRLAMPVCVIVLSLLAVPLSRVQPRKGRFSKLFVGVVFAIAYLNFLTMWKRWIAAKIMPTMLGLWVVHGLFILIALVLALHVSGRLHVLLFKLKQYRLR